MPKHARNRSLAKRLVSTRAAVVVGAFAAVSFGAVAGTAHAAEPAASTAPHASGKVYTVKKGDHLMAIARTHPVMGGWRAIAALNHISSPYVIYPGQQLKLPPAPSARTTGSAPTPAPATATGTAKPASDVTYPDNLNGWIDHSLAIMRAHGIPGTYNGIYRNVMRESSGNPNAINLWDSNAAKGTPSIGLLQTIRPTFEAYHVPGTSTNIYDPVANITAACNYAFHVYGSIDNVNGPY